MPFHLDYMTLTGDEVVRRGTSFPIKYQLTGSPQARVTFYYDTDKNPSTGRTLIGSTVSPGRFRGYLPLVTRGSVAPPPEIDLYANSRTFTWATNAVPDGTYYISADAQDGGNTTTWYSETPVIVTP